MIRGKFGQARCQACHSWHFAIQLDDNLNPIEFKCCRCGRIIEYKVKTKLPEMELSVKKVGKLARDENGNTDKK